MNNSGKEGLYYSIATLLGTGSDGAVWLVECDKKVTRGFKSGVVGLEAQQPILRLTE